MKTVAYYQRGAIGVERIENVPCKAIGKIFQVSLFHTSGVRCDARRDVFAKYPGRQLIAHKSP